MGATLNLTNNGHVLHYVLNDPVNIADIKAVEQQANSYYDQAQHKLHTLMDLGQLRSLPNGIFQFRGTKGLAHRNSGETVVVVASVYVQLIADTFIRLSGNKHIHFFSPKEMSAAWEYLDQVIAAEAIPQ